MDNAQLLALAHRLIAELFEVPLAQVAATDQEEIIIAWHGLRDYQRGDSCLPLVHFATISEQTRKD